MRLFCVKQKEENDCALACLATIARYYGKKISINNLAQYTTKINSELNIYELCNIADEIGFEATAYQCMEDFNEKDLIEPVPLTERTGRVHAGMASMEYLPRKAFQNLDYIIDREDVPIILEENSQSIIQNYEKNGSNMSMEIQNVTEETSIELPYIYYLGYRVYVNDQEISYTESDKGFIQISINEDAKITVKYTGTNAMIISYIISFIFILVLLFISNYSKIKTQLNKNRR